MSAGPKIERRYRGLSREELGRLIRQEAREAMRIVTPKIEPGAKPRRPASGGTERDVPSRNERRAPSPTVQAVSKAAIVEIPREPTDAAKALIAKRESICARCEHFNGVCTLVFPQVKGCRSLNRYRPGWLAFAADAGNVCPLGRWNANQE